FYANTDDVGAGSGIGYGFHQQLLGASWDLPLPKKYVELRLMWLSAHDTGMATTVQTGLNGQTSTVTDPLAVPGGGDMYGIAAGPPCTEMAVDERICLGI